MDVSVAVQVGRRKSGAGHAIDLRLALAGNVRRVEKAKRSPGKQRGQRVELAALALGQ